MTAAGPPETVVIPVGRWSGPPFACPGCSNPRGILTRSYSPPPGSLPPVNAAYSTTLRLSRGELLLFLVHSMPPQLAGGDARLAPNVDVSHHFW